MTNNLILNAINLDKYLIKWTSIFSLSILAAVEGLLHAINNTIGYFIPVIVIVIVDMWSAMSLNKRVAEKYPALVESTGWKVKSQPTNKAVMKVVKMFAGVIIGSFVDQTGVFGSDVGVNTVFIGFVLAQTWSILENSSSENNKRWAKVAQYVVMDKTSRHLNIDKDVLDKLLNEKTLQDEINSKLEDYSSSNNIPNTVGIDDTTSNEDDIQIKNGSRNGEKQRQISDLPLKWRNGKQYDIEAYRTLLQELNRQFDERLKEGSKRAED